MDNWTYSGLVVNGKNVSKTILNSQTAISTLVSDSAKLIVNSGGYVESTTVRGNGTYISNGGVAVSTVLSGGIMTLLEGGVASCVDVRSNARLNVRSGCVATGVVVNSGGNVYAVVYGNDSVTRIEGTNEIGSFSLSNGVASNFVINAGLVYTVSSGGIAVGTVIRKNGTVMLVSGGTATGIIQERDAKISARVYGGDSQTCVAGSNECGEFLLSGGVASGFVLNENVAQYVYSGGTALDTVISGAWGLQQVSSGGFVSATSMFNGTMTIYGGADACDIVASGGTIEAAGGNISGATIWKNGVLLVSAAATGADESGGADTNRLSDITIMSGGTMEVARSATFVGDIAIYGKMAISQGVTMNTLTVGSGGSAEVAGTFNISDTSWNTNVVKNGKVNVLNGGAALGGAVSSGGIMRVSGGGTAQNIRVLSGGALEVDSDAQLDDTTVCAGGVVNVLAGGAASGGVVSGGGAMYVSGGAAYGIRVLSGGALEVDSDARLDDTTVCVGGALTLADGAYTGERLTLDFADSPGNAAGLINDLSLVSSETSLLVTGISAVGTYLIADAGGSETNVVDCRPNTTFHTPLCPGDRRVDVFGGRTYDFDNGGAELTVGVWNGEPKSSFSSPTPLDSTTELEDYIYDYAAVWSGGAVHSGSLCVVSVDSAGSAGIEGNAWLRIEGTNLSGAALYGTPKAVELDGAIHLLATSGAVIGNLAAGAGTSGGAVAGVALIIDDATVAGVGYAGGFGNVAYYDANGYWTPGEVTTYVKNGTFGKDFYAGVLANHARTGMESDLGDVTLTVENGTFKGNLFGASAVKGSAENILSAGKVTISIGGGSARKDDFCLFAGGYAFGTANNSNVYSVDDITLTVSGGDWGHAHGGRGIFGGILAAGVTAEAGNVELTISGDATMGNVFGGGWAQQGGDSIVGDVNITIAGGTIKNVFGGGSHSTTNGTTEAGDVTITVSGGNITGDIFARGQRDGDSVTSARVIFTGSDGFLCNVWGYSCVPEKAGDGEDEGAALSFTGYTGTFSGRIGGFDKITLDGATAMTLTTAAEEVINTAWIFDVSERDAAFADTVLLNWAGADFSGDTISMNLAPGDVGEWSLVNASKTTTAANFDKFDVLVDGVSVLGYTIGLGDAIEGGAYDGWGFTLENNMLKFRHLA